MRVSRLVYAIMVGSLAGTSVASAQTAEVQVLRDQVDQLRKDLDTLNQRYGDRVAALEAKLAALQAGQTIPATSPPAATAQPPLNPPPPPAAALSAEAAPPAQMPAGAAGAGGPSGTLPVYGSAISGSKVFNPDIAVIGDFLGAAGRNLVAPTPALEMHETETSFQAVVDPYARADFFITFGEQGVNLEEGFITFTSLPGGLLTKVGRLRAAFGKANGMHNHVLPWSDRPLVTQNLVGGEDGIADAGISVARLIPNPWLFLEATGQVFRGDSAEDLFKSSERGDLSYIGHLRAYQDITEDSNLDFGFSASRGHNRAGLVNGVDIGRFTTTLYGVDATYRWRPLSRSIYRSFVGRSEWVWSRREQFNGRQNSLGYYVSGDYQFARRWFAGARYDSANHADDASLLDSGGSLLLTYWPSEFSQLRGQYRRTNYALRPSANEFLFQFQFAIGAHGAHPF